MKRALPLLAILVACNAAPQGGPARLTISRTSLSSALENASRARLTIVCEDPAEGTPTEGSAPTSGTGPTRASDPLQLDLPLGQQTDEFTTDVPTCTAALKLEIVYEDPTNTPLVVPAYRGEATATFVAGEETEVDFLVDRVGEIVIRLATEANVASCALTFDEQVLTLTPEAPQTFVVAPGAYEATCTAQGDLSVAFVAIVSFAAHSEVVITQLVTEKPPDVLLPPSALTYSEPSPIYPIGAPITPNVPSTLGGKPTHYAITDEGMLTEMGLSFDQASGIISGTPSLGINTFPFTITASNAAGETSTELTITVFDATPPPPHIAYSTVNAIYIVGEVITPNVMTSTGGPFTTLTIGPGTGSGLSLPATTGLSFDPITGTISGTASLLSSANTYQVFATGPGGASLAGVTITVVASAAPSCSDILAASPGAPDAVYLIDPDGSGGVAPFQAFCDMTTDGGGWMKILQYPNAAYLPSALAVGTIAENGVSAFAKLSDLQINSFGPVSLYRMQGSTSSSKLFLQSDATFNDTTAGWGLFAANTQGEVTSIPYDGNLLSFTSSASFDTFNTSPSLSGDGCERMFTDSPTAFGCYPSIGAMRCVTVGSSCATPFAMVEDFTMWKRSASLSGALDLSFGVNGKVVMDHGNDYHVLVSSDSIGRTVVAVDTGIVKMCRLDALGNIDPSFNGGACTDVSNPLANESLGTLLVDPNDHILYGTTRNGQIMGLGRLDPTGAHDSTFGAAGIVTSDNACNAGVNQPDHANALALTAGGTIVVGGSSQGNLGADDTGLWEYSTIGGVVSSFSGDGFICDDLNVSAGGGNYDGVVGLAVDASDDIFVLSGANAPQTKFILTHFSSLGVRDAGFAATAGYASYQGPFGSNTTPVGLALFNGKLYAVGSDISSGVSTDFIVVRYQTDGTIDPLWGNSGVARYSNGTQLAIGGANSFAIDSYGYVYVIGTMGSGAASDVILVRFNNSGQPDGNFGVGGAIVADGLITPGVADYGDSIAFDATGSLLVGARAFNGSGNDVVIARFR